MGNIRHIWSWAGDSNSKDQTLWCTYTSISQAEGSPQASGHLIPVSAQDNVEMAEASLGEVPTTISPIAAALRSRSVMLPVSGPTLREDQQSLRGAIGHQIIIDAHRWKAVWELGMDLHQNNSETAESIKEAKAICAHASRRPKPSALQPS